MVFVHNILRLHAAASGPLFLFMSINHDILLSINFFVELKLLVRFATGMECLPPKPYHRKTLLIKFQDSVVCGATCTRTLTIPLCDDYIVFKAAILSAIKDSDSYNMY